MRDGLKRLDEWYNCLDCAAASTAGPFALPLLGNLPQIVAEDLPKYVQRLTPKYGPVFKVRQAPRTLFTALHDAKATSCAVAAPDGSTHAATGRASSSIYRTSV